MIELVGSQNCNCAECSVAVRSQLRGSRVVIARGLGSEGTARLPNVLPKGRRKDNLWLNAAVEIAAPEHQCTAIVSMLFELLCSCSNFRFNWWTRAESAR